MIKKKQAFAVAALCASIQYYDYHLYGFLASTIAKVFFPDSSAAEQLQKAYFVMFLGVIAKPLGALVLGRIGDLYGRSKTMTLSLLGTALGSIVISITPSYDEIGIFAAFILTLARMTISGMVSSGTDGVRIFIYEQIDPKRQCFGNGLVTMATMIGSFLASLSAWFFTLSTLPDYSWRFAFLIGAVMGIFVVFLRNVFAIEDHVEEKNKGDYDKYKSVPTLHIVFNNFNLFILSAILAGCIGASSGQFSLIFFGTYMFKILNLIDESHMKFYTTVGVVLYMLFSVVAGFVADQFGRVKVTMIAGVMLILVTIFNAYFIWNNILKIELYFAMNILLPFMTMPSLAFIKQAIPVAIRYRMFSFAHAWGSICLSGTMAMSCTYLYKVTELSFAPLVYFGFIIVLMMGTIYLITSKYTGAIEGIDKE